LLESLNALVEVVIVVRAYVDKDAMTENVTQILLAGPVVCDITGQVERLPVLYSFVIDFAGDFVPGLSNESVCDSICDILEHKVLTSRG